MILSTDFDGTISPFDPEVRVSPELFEAIERLVDRRGAVWVINTGRDWKSLAETMSRKGFPRMPDWVVLIEREIYRVNGEGLSPHKPWNTGCREAHRELFENCREAFKQIESSVSNLPDLQIIVDSGSPIGLIAHSPAQAEVVAARLADILQGYENLAAVRNDIYFRFAHTGYNKGTALVELSRHLGVAKEKVFAAGDHYNDLEMLKGTNARMLACPSNAICAVKRQVLSEGGYVSEMEADLGTLDAMRHYGLVTSWS